MYLVTSIQCEPVFGLFFFLRNKGKTQWVGKAKQKINLRWPNELSKSHGTDIQIFLRCHQMQCHNYRKYQFWVVAKTLLVWMAFFLATNFCLSACGTNFSFFHCLVSSIVAVTYEWKMCGFFMHLSCQQEETLKGLKNNTPYTFVTKAACKMITAWGHFLIILTEGIL